MGRRRRNLRLAEQLTRAAVMILLLDCEAARGQVAQSAAASQSSSGDLTQVRILLAEDNPVNQLLTTRLLEKRGHTVMLASNGREALAAFERKSFDLVLMDVQMPQMDGIEATAAIRNLEKSSGNHVAIVALTAYAMKGDREKCLAAGMDGYLSKPIQTQNSMKCWRSAGNR